MTTEAATILDEIKQVLQRAQSPWAGRQQAAAHCDCEAHLIDAAANRGEIKRYWAGSDPRFKKVDLDKWLENNPQPKRKRGRKAQNLCEEAKR